MGKEKNVLYVNRAQIRKNIRAIRHYMFMNTREFSYFCGLPPGRGEELETRYRPRMEEIEKIAKAAEIPIDRIINGIIYVTIQYA